MWYASYLVWLVQLALSFSASFTDGATRNESITSPPYLKIPLSTLMDHLDDSGTWWEIDKSIPPMSNFRNKLAGGRLFLRFVDGLVGTPPTTVSISHDSQISLTKSNVNSVQNQSEKNQAFENPIVAPTTPLADRITTKSVGQREHHRHNKKISSKNTYSIDVGNEDTSNRQRKKRRGGSQGDTQSHGPFEDIPKEMLQLPSRRHLEELLGSDIEESAHASSGFPSSIGMTAHQQIQAAHRLIQNSSAYHSCYEYRLYTLQEQGDNDHYYELSRTNRFCYPAIVVTGLPKCSTTAIYHLLSQYPFSRSSSGKENCIAKYYGKSILDYFDSLVINGIRENDVIINGCIDIVNNVHVRNILRNPNTFYLVRK